MWRNEDRQREGREQMYLQSPNRQRKRRKEVYLQGPMSWVVSQNQTHQDL